MVSNYSLTTFKSKLKDIARPYNFELDFKGEGFKLLQETLDKNVSFYARAASFPGLTFTSTVVGLSGINYKVAGVPTYEPFNCSLIVDAEYKTVKAIHDTLNIIYEWQDSPKFKTPEEYFGEVEIRGLDNDRKTKFSKTLHMAFLQNVGPISYNHDNKDSSLQIDITIEYSYYTVK